MPRSNPNPMDLHELKSGRIRALFDRESGFLRHVRVGPTGILRGVYAAVRDHNWNTIPARISDLRIESGTDRLEVTFSVHHEDGSIDFRWSGRIRIEARGRIHYEFDGQAGSDFLRNRIGFCVLHSPDCAGGKIGIETVEGTHLTSTFPREISPHQPFRDLRSIAHRPADGLAVTVRMEGDTFEMEDQRNWTDASFKTYCTPLGLTFPVRIAAGTRIHQSITIEIEGEGLREPTGSAQEEGVRLVARSPEIPTRLPPIGLSFARSGPLPLSAKGTLNLRDLQPTHLRVDLFAGGDEWTQVWNRAAEQARALGSPLEIALHLDRDPAAELTALQRLLASESPAPAVRRFLVFSSQSITTPPEELRMAREELGPLFPNAAFGVGTDAYFTEINRHRPPVSGADCVAFSINPQVHAFDDLSLIETLPMQGLVVRNAASFTGLPVVVSPVSLRPRFNPNATGPEPEPAPGKPPASVDLRQGRSFGAAWTLGSIKHLAEAGAAAITLFETVGARGVVADPSTPDWLDLPSTDPGDPLPPFAVLRALAGWTGAGIVPLVSSHPLQVDGLMLQRDDQTLLLLSNYGREELDAWLDLGQAVVWDSIRFLTDHPVAIPPTKTGPDTPDRSLTLHLQPHTVIALHGKSFGSPT